MNPIRIAWTTACGALAALIALCVAWEIWLAPLRPGGSFLALKALPLALPLGGILAGRRRSYQWSALLVLAYFGEGLARSWTDTGLSRLLAVLEIALSLAYLAAAISFIRSRGRGGSGKAPGDSTGRGPLPPIP